MNHSIATSNSINRCDYRTPAGRRCRARIQDARTNLCPKHAALHGAVKISSDFLQRLTADTDDFTTAMGIHNSLSELYKLLAADLITARRAAVLAYISNLLLRTIPVVHKELDPALNCSNTVEIDFGDLPRPNRAISTTTGASQAS
jgi:hypothetical protein